MTRRRRLVLAVALALVAAVFLLAACGAGDDDEPTTNPAPAPAPSTPEPPSAGALPPRLLKCFADKGFEIESPTQIHSAPPRLVNQCFGALHSSGPVP